MCWMKRTANLQMKMKFDFCEVHMKVNCGDRVVEYSYMDLLAALYEDVDADKCMPEEEQAEVLNAIEDLSDMLEKYSG